MNRRLGGTRMKKLESISILVCVVIVAVNINETWSYDPSSRIDHRAIFRLQLARRR